MEINQVTRKLSYSYSSILEAKVRNFLKKSVFLYLIASFLVFNGMNQLMKVNNKVLLFISIYVVLLIFGVLVIIISSYFQLQKRKNSGYVISFMEGHISVGDEKTGNTVEREWSWIKKVELFKDSYYFDINVKPKEVIILRRTNLSEQEDRKLQEWIKLNSKLIV
jgi:hypothetical protein